MPNINTMKSSKFLKRDEVMQRPMLVTISHVSEENVAKEGAPEELKWCAHFNETDKPLVLNTTNMQLIARIANSDETDDWTGAIIVLYDDPNVSFGGKLVGGIRVRAPRAAKQAMSKIVAPPEAEAEDDIPY